MSSTWDMLENRLRTVETGQSFVFRQGWIQAWGYVNLGRFL